MDSRGQGELAVIALVAFVIIVLFGAVAFGGPIYNVWASGLSGEAKLKEATYSKQVAVQEAQAKLDSSKLLAEAEVERAKGVAQANQIIGDSLKGNEDYLRYLYINGLTENPAAHEVIYIPTEAGIPILEAGRK